MSRTLLLALLLGVPACMSDREPVTAEPGTSLPGLGDADRGQFAAGLALFDKVYTPEEGLGPAFNENQCSACHTSPASGGTTGFERVVKATRYDAPGSCDLLSGDGGENVRSQTTPPLRALGIEREEVPPNATEIGRFLPTPLFGLGLIEAIPEDAIIARADPDDRDGDGISGRAARGADGGLTRFGRKADFATIEAFNRAALRFEMGLTSRATDRDAVGGAPPPAGTDPVAEPEVDARTVELLTAFVRFLAAPAPAPATSKEHADTLAAGARLFAEIGCAACHTPSMRTGDSDVPAFRRRTVPLYSDLLLHDMGSALANVCAPDAAPAELRTTPLWGLQHRDLYLHDGRASDLRDAILLHGGEAQASRDAFEALPWIRQEYVVRFLQSL